MVSVTESEGGGVSVIHQAGDGHAPCSMWVIYSSGNCLTVATTGLVAKSPSAHSTLPEISPDRDTSKSRSPGAPRPASIRFKILKSHEVPSRHGVHLPHDS